MSMRANDKVEKKDIEAPQASIEKVLSTDQEILIPPISSIPPSPKTVTAPTGSTAFNVTHSEYKHLNEAKEIVRNAKFKVDDDIKDAFNKVKVALNDIYGSKKSIYDQIKNSLNGINKNLKFSKLYANNFNKVGIRKKNDRGGR